MQTNASLLHIHVVPIPWPNPENRSDFSDEPMTPKHHPGTETRHLLLVEDNPVFVDQIHQALQQSNTSWRVCAVSEGGEALALIRSEREYFDLALIDIGLPDMSGVELIRSCSQWMPELPIVVISVMASEPVVMEAIEAGAKGYILKDNPIHDIAQGIQQIMNGIYPLSPALARFLFKKLTKPTLKKDSVANAEFKLTPREYETLQLLSQGLTYAQVAAQMGVTLSTIQWNVRNLYRKLNVKSQVQAISKAREKDLI
jgi:DNA-binding NarL/FixJ family response regulator